MCNRIETIPVPYRLEGDYDTTACHYAISRLSEKNPQLSVLIQLYGIKQIVSLVGSTLGLNLEKAGFLEGDTDAASLTRAEHALVIGLHQAIHLLSRVSYYDTQAIESAQPRIYEYRSGIIHLMLRDGSRNMHAVLTPEGSYPLYAPPIELFKNGKDDPAMVGTTMRRMPGHLAGRNQILVFSAAGMFSQDSLTRGHTTYLHSRIGDTETARNMYAQNTFYPYGMNSSSHIFSPERFQLLFKQLVTKHEQVARIPSQLKWLYTNQHHEFGILTFSDLLRQVESIREMYISLVPIVDYLDSNDTHADGSNYDLNGMVLFRDSQKNLRNAALCGNFSSTPEGLYHVARNVATRFDTLASDIGLVLYDGGRSTGIVAQTDSGFQTFGDTSPVFVQHEVQSGLIITQ